MTTDSTQATHMANSGKSPSYAPGDAQAEQSANSAHYSELEEMLDDSWEDQ